MSKSLSDNLKALMHAMAASAEAFLHHTFGERYTAVMLNTLLLAAAVSLAAPVLAPETPAPLMPLFTAAFYVRLLAHLVSVWRRRRAGVHVQSYSSGISWSVWTQLRLPAGVIHGLVEPLLCLAAAFLLSPVDRVLSIWLRFAALALMLKAMIHRREGHQQMLDALDDRMSARNRHAALQQQTNPRLETPDHPVTLNAPVTPAPARPLPGLFRNLDPALQRLMQQNAPEAEPVPAPIHVRPANAKPDSASTQRPAGRWGVPAAPGAVRVLPAQVTSPAPPPAASPAASSAARRVVLVRTRPAPEAPLRVVPAMPPGQFGRPGVASTTNPSAARSGADVPRQWPAPVPKRSEAVPVPNPAEVRKPEPAAASAPPSLAATSGEKPTANETPSESEPCDQDRDSQEQDTLREMIRGEAARLGFTVEVAGRPDAQSRPRGDLTLTKGSVSLAVEIAVSTTTDHEFGNVKKCLDSDVARVAIVSPNPERLKAFAEAMHAGLPLEEAMKVGYFGPQEFVEELRRLARASENLPHSATPRKRTRRGDTVRRDGPPLTPEEHNAKEGHS